MSKAPKGLSHNPQHGGYRGGGSSLGQGKTDKSAKKPKKTLAATSPAREASDVAPLEERDSPINAPMVAETQARDIEVISPGAEPTLSEGAIGEHASREEAAEAGTPDVEVAQTNEAREIKHAAEKPGGTAPPSLGLADRFREYSGVPTTSKASGGQTGLETAARPPPPPPPPPRRDSIVGPGRKDATPGEGANRVDSRAEHNEVGTPRVAHTPSRRGPKGGKTKGAQGPLIVATPPDEGAEMLPVDSYKQYDSSAWDKLAPPPPPPPPPTPPASLTATSAVSSRDMWKEPVRFGDTQRSVDRDRRRGGSSPHERGSGYRDGGHRDNRGWAGRDRCRDSTPHEKEMMLKEAEELERRAKDIKRKLESGDHRGRTRSPARRRSRTRSRSPTRRRTRSRSPAHRHPQRSGEPDQTKRKASPTPREDKRSRYDPYEVTSSDEDVIRGSFPSREWEQSRRDLHSLYELRRDAGAVELSNRVIKEFLTTTSNTIPPVDVPFGDKAWKTYLQFTKGKAALKMYSSNATNLAYYTHFEPIMKKVGINAPTDDVLAAADLVDILLAEQARHAHSAAEAHRAWQHRRMTPGQNLIAYFHECMELYTDAHVVNKDRASTWVNVLEGLSITMHPEMHGEDPRRWRALVDNIEAIILSLRGLGDILLSDRDRQDCLRKLKAADDMEAVGDKKYWMAAQHLAGVGSTATTPNKSPVAPSKPSVSTARATMFRYLGEEEARAATPISHDGAFGSETQLYQMAEAATQNATKAAYEDMDEWQKANSRSIAGYADQTCFHCGTAGHIARICPIRTGQLRNPPTKDPKKIYEARTKYGGDAREIRPRKTVGGGNPGPSASVLAQTLSLLSTSNPAAFADAVRALATQGATTTQMGGQHGGGRNDTGNVDTSLSNINTQPQVMPTPAAVRNPPQVANGDTTGPDPLQRTAAGSSSLLLHATILKHKLRKRARGGRDGGAECGVEDMVGAGMAGMNVPEAEGRPGSGLSGTGHEAEALMVMPTEEQDWARLPRVASKPHSRTIIKVGVAGTTMGALVDTGASKCFVSITTVKALGLWRLVDTSHREAVCVGDGAWAESIGTVALPIELVLLDGDLRKVPLVALVPLVILPGLPEQVVLGANWLNHFRETRILDDRLFILDRAGVAGSIALEVVKKRVRAEIPEAPTVVTHDACDGRKNNCGPKDKGVYIAQMLTIGPGEVMSVPVYGILKETVELWDTDNRSVDTSGRDSTPLPDELGLRPVAIRVISWKRYGEVGHPYDGVDGDVDGSLLLCNTGSTPTTVRQGRRVAVNVTREDIHRVVCEASPSADGQGKKGKRQRHHRVNMATKLLTLEATLQRVQGQDRGSEEDMRLATATTIANHIEVDENDCGLATVEEVKAKVADILTTQIAAFYDKRVKTFPVCKIAKHRIEVDTSRLHEVRTPQYKMSAMDLQRLSEAVKECLEQGVIESTQDSPCQSAMIPVVKPDGSTRMVQDSKKLNRITRNDNRYPMPDLLTAVQRASKWRYTSTMDVKSGFHQIELDESSRHLTAFAIPGLGQFRYKRMTQGLKGSPATFNSVMREVLKECMEMKVDDETVSEVILYVDDVLIGSNTVEHHLKHLDKVLTAFATAGMAIEMRKTKVLVNRYRFLGRMVEFGKLEPHRDHIQGLLEFTPPKTRKEMQRFLGLLNYVTAYIPKEKILSQPLRDMSLPTKERERRTTFWREAKARERGQDEYRPPDDLQARFDEAVKRLDNIQQEHDGRKSGGARLVWTNETREAWLDLREAIKHPKALAAPDYDRQFCIHVDASLYGAGATLYQEKRSDVGEMVCSGHVAFASRAFKPYERLLSVFDREAIALVFGLKAFQPYIEGRDVKVNTDHVTVAKAFNMGIAKDRMRALWLATINQLCPSLTVNYIAGHLNQADALSRNPAYEIQMPQEYVEFYGNKYNDDAEDYEDVALNMLTTSRDRVRLLMSEPETNGSARNLRHLLLTRQSGGWCGGGLTFPELKCSTELMLGKTRTRGQPRRQIRRTPLTMASEQNLDPVLARIKAFLEAPPSQKSDPMYTDEVIKAANGAAVAGGILYKMVNGEARCWAPESLYELLLRDAHEHRMGGHSSGKKMAAKLRRSYYWPKLREECEEHVRRCSACDLTKSKFFRQTQRQHTGEIGMEADHPFHTLSMDVKGPLAADCGQRFLICFVCTKTRYGVVFLSKRHTAIDVARCLARVIMRYGVPRKIHSDQGPEFFAEMATELFQILGIEHHEQATYSPWLNGKVERFQQTIAANWRTASASAGSDKLLEEALDWVVAAYNMSPHEAFQNKLSPHEMLTGYKAVTLSEAALQIPYYSQDNEAARLIHNVRELTARTRSQPTPGSDRLRVGMWVMHLPPTKFGKRQQLKGPYQIAKMTQGGGGETRVWLKEPHAIMERPFDQLREATSIEQRRS